MKTSGSDKERTYASIIQKQKAFFATHQTKSYAFRKQQLELLYKAIQDNEAAISDALKADLGKSVFESYASEIGFVLAEISDTLRKLKKWMRPERKASGLLSFPSKSLIYKEPKGLTLIIGPWNYPFQLVLTPVVASIAAGNTIVIKPAEQSLHTAAVIERLIQETFDESYIAVVQGEGYEVVPNLMNTHRFDHVFFTGSTGVGRKIAEMAATNLTPCTLELGGKSPAIIHESAKLAVTARRIAFGKWMNAGQTCVAPDYILVHKSLKQPFIDQLADTIKAFYGENPLENQDYPKIINEARFEILLNLMKGAEVLYGGKSDKSRLRIEPTLVSLPSVDRPLMGEEIFGPILPILTFEHLEEAFEIIAANPNPLALYLFANDQKVEQKVIQEIPFGGGMINNSLVHFINGHIPFGGIGESGWGNYHGIYGFNTFSHLKSVMKTGTWFDLNNKYPPQSKQMYLFLKWLFK